MYWPRDTQPAFGTCGDFGAGVAAFLGRDDYLHCLQQSSTRPTISYSSSPLLHLNFVCWRTLRVPMHSCRQLWPLMGSSSPARHRHGRSALILGRRTRTATVRPVRLPSHSCYSPRRLTYVSTTFLTLIDIPLLGLHVPSTLSIWADTPSAAAVTYGIRLTLVNAHSQTVAHKV